MTRETSHESKGGGNNFVEMLEALLFVIPDKENSPATSNDAIKNRVLLKIERAEIMSAMIAMRDNDETNDKNTH